MGLDIATVIVMAKYAVLIRQTNRILTDHIEELCPQL
jgi:hypothetical protein